MTPGDDRTHDQLGRIDTKLDVLISQHSSLAGMVADHETRLRTIEVGHTAAVGVVAELGKDVVDHEQRIRAADRWRYAIPLTTLGALLAGTAAIIGAVKGH
ncbi:MAG: hypothetical protein JWN52_7205 [Actinomycetia bacterium]|nr:hypothetical protein [Actinomycetes bacterium]